MTFEERLQALEAAVAANALPPTLAVLQRKLEASWQPSADVLLEPGSLTITAAMLREARGRATVNGAGTPTVDVAVTDGLPAAGKCAIAGWDVPGSVFIGDYIRVFALSYAAGTTTFRLVATHDVNITLGQAVAINYRIWTP